MVEIWKDIDGYCGLYQVSNLGRVRSLTRRVRNSRNSNCESTIQGKILSPGSNGNGYLQVGLCNKGKIKYHTIHRLVATSFIPNEFSLPEVNHKDCDTHNNVVSNLEWCTRQYNVTYADAQKKKSTTVTKKVAQLSDDGEIVRTFPSAKAASEQFGCCKSTITHCCNGRNKSACGYKWRYV